MLTRSRRHRERLAPNADINLINLVDLAFVLLIIFMITAQMLQSSIEVQLPQTAATPMNAEQGLVVTVQKDGRIYIGDVPVSSTAEFTQLLPSHLKAQGKREVYLKGDREVPYGRVLELFGIMKQLNVADVSLVVDPEAQRR